MKKYLSILLVLLMLCSVFLTACDTEDTASTTSSTQSSDNSSNGGSNNGGGNGDGGKKDPEIPSKPPVGYTFFTINDLRFAYPQNWTVGTDDDGETEISGDGNNMQISYDQGAAVFQNITAEEYYSILAPIIEAEGITVSNVTAEKRENSLGLEINVIIADLSYQGISMKQVTYATTLNNNAYAIILTLLEENADLEEKIFDSMVNLNPTEDEGNTPPDPNAPAGYKTFTNYNLRFAYPDTWTTSAVANTRGATFEGGLYRLDLTSGDLTTMFSSLTTESFRENMVPGLEEQLEGTIADEYVEQVRNENGLTVTLVSFSITDADMSGWMIWYCVDIDQSTHCLMLTTVTENEELIMTIFNSLTAVDGPNVSTGSESDSGTSTKPGDTSDSGTSSKPEGADPGTSTTPSNPSNNEREIYEEAKRFYTKKEYDKAYALFSQIPDYPGVDSYLDELEELLNSNDSSIKTEK